MPRNHRKYGHGSTVRGVRSRDATPMSLGGGVMKAKTKKNIIEA